MFNSFLPPDFQNTRVWLTTNATGPVVAIFNLADTPASIRATWAQLGVAGGTHTARNLLVKELSIARSHSEEKIMEELRHIFTH